MIEVLLFAPFVIAFGLCCANDPLTRRFWEDLWEG